MYETLIIYCLFNDAYSNCMIKLQRQINRKVETALNEFKTYVSLLAVSR